ncbi:hypothetical protein ACOMHN_021270 [Nucella lapillus]
MAATKRVPRVRRPSEVDARDSSDDVDYSFLLNKFTVKDILRMFKLSLCGGLADDDEENDPRIQMLLKMMGDSDSDTEVCTKHKPGHIKLETRHSSQILAALPSVSTILHSSFATSETVLERKEILVHPVVREAYRRMLEYKAVPNSTLKKLPKTCALPPLPWEQLMRRKVTMIYLDHYPEKPRPKYPIYPPRREKPAPPPKPTGKKKKKKKRKEKKQLEKPKEPISLNKWRRENLPVASTRLWRSYFAPRACFQPTPPFSRPPSPAGDVPDPNSPFGYFINHLGVDDQPKKPTRSDKKKNKSTNPTRAAARRGLDDTKPVYSRMSFIRDPSFTMSTSMMSINAGDSRRTILSPDISWRSGLF